MPDITITITDEAAERLAVLVDPAWGSRSVADVVAQLADHAQQGVMRPGSWERLWVISAFGTEWTLRMEPDTDGLSGDGRVVFERPAAREDGTDG